MEGTPSVGNVRRWKSDNGTGSVVRDPSNGADGDNKFWYGDGGVSLSSCLSYVAVAACRAKRSGWRLEEDDVDGWYPGCPIGFMKISGNPPKRYNGMKRENDGDALQYDEMADCWVR